MTNLGVLFNGEEDGGVRRDLKSAKDLIARARSFFFSKRFKERNVGRSLFVH